eukprot:5064963-Heterocapsa_arctica.AAC.1
MCSTISGAEKKAEWDAAGEDLDKMWNVIDSLATENQYIRAGEPLGQPKDGGKVLWSEDFPKPKELESE